MHRDEDLQAKVQASRNAGAGIVGRGLTEDMCGRPGLRERVEKRLGHAQQEARQADRLTELSMLLCQHPEIARILDLYEEFR